MMSLYHLYCMFRRKGWTVIQSIKSSWRIWK